MKQLAASAICVCLFLIHTGCSNKAASLATPEARFVEAFEQIELGMSAEQVGSLLGHWVIGPPGPDYDAWYTVHSSEPYDSPYSLASVRVAYRDGAVVEKELKGNPKHLFQRVEIGMPREQVETILGKPLVPEVEPNGWATYLPPAPLRRHESPSLGSIEITYSNGVVAEKELSYQADR